MQRNRFRAAKLSSCSICPDQRSGPASNSRCPNWRKEIFSGREVIKTPKIHLAVRVARLLPGPRLPSNQLRCVVSQCDDGEWAGKKKTRAELQHQRIWYFFVDSQVDGDNVSSRLLVSRVFISQIKLQNSLATSTSSSSFGLLLRRARCLLSNLSWWYVSHFPCSYRLIIPI